MTNKGLAIHVPKSDVGADGNARLRLNCWKRKDGEFDIHPTHLAVLITLAERPPGSNTYYRWSCDDWLQDEAVNAPSAEEMKDTTCIYILGLYI
jgi:hypothetical protein